MLSLSLRAMEGFYGVGTLEIYLDPHIVACPFEPFPQSMEVRYHYCDVVVVVVCSTVVDVVVGSVVSGSLSIVDAHYHTHHTTTTTTTAPTTTTTPTTPATTSTTVPAHTNS